MAEEALEVGQRLDNLTDFEHGAEKEEKVLHNSLLNPPKLSLKQKIGRFFAGAVIGGAAAGGGQALATNTDTIDHMKDSAHTLVMDTKDAVVSPLIHKDLGEGVTTNEVMDATLLRITNDQEQNLGPAFRSEPNMGGHEYSKEELIKKGFDPNSKDAHLRIIRDGGTYPSNLKDGFIDGENGNPNHGVWGEIMVEDPQTGHYKGTGIYLTENFFQKKETEDNTSQN